MTEGDLLWIHTCGGSGGGCVCCVGERTERMVWILIGEGSGVAEEEERGGIWCGYVCCVGEKGREDDVFAECSLCWLGGVFYQVVTDCYGES